MIRRGRRLPRLSWSASLAVRQALELADEELRRWANLQLPDDHEPYCPIAKKYVPPRADCYCYLAGPRGVVRKLGKKVQDMERHKYQIGDPVRWALLESGLRMGKGERGSIVGKQSNRLTEAPEYWVRWQTLGETSFLIGEHALEIDAEAEGGLEAIERHYGPMRKRLRRLRRWVRS